MFVILVILKCENVECPQKLVHRSKEDSDEGEVDFGLWSYNVRFAIFYSRILCICIKLFETCSTLLLPAAVDAATLESCSLDRLFECAHSKYFFAMHFIKRNCIWFLLCRLSNRQWQLGIVFITSEWAERSRIRERVLCVCIASIKLFFYRTHIKNGLVHLKLDDA